jgi:hypothetical protein
MVDKKSKGDVKGVSQGHGKPPVAGSGSNKVDASKPAYRNGSSYMPAENVNDGVMGGKKGKVAEGGGQNSDNWAAEWNKLVGQSDYQKDPYRARGMDFPVQHVDARTGQSGTYGFSQGHNELVELTGHLEGARHNEDDGPMTPVPGDRSRKVGQMFSIEMNKGEGNSDTGEIGIEQMIDLQTGHIVGGNTGMTNYVPEGKVSVGKPPSRNMSAGHVGQER